MSSAFVTRMSHVFVMCHKVLRAPLVTYACRLPQRCTNQHCVEMHCHLGFVHFLPFAGMQHTLICPTWAPPDCVFICAKHLYKALHPLHTSSVQSITSPAHIICTKHYIPCTHQSIRVLELIVCLLQLLKGLSCCRSRVFVWMHKDGQLPVCSAELATADCPSGLAHFIQLRSWQLQQPALRTMRHNTNVP